MLTKSEKLVWAAAFVYQLNKNGDTYAATRAACIAVLSMRTVDIPKNEHDWEPEKMLKSMREMKP